jgi:hypothetical protein
MTNLTTLRPMSPAFREVAEIQDEIGWCKFLHGKVSTKIRKLQGAHCILAGTNINGHKWMKHFIQQLVEISHAQWLYCNFSLHHYAKGYLHQRTVNEISRDIELLAGTRPSDILQESIYLLEIPQQPLHSLSPVHKAYWVLAMKAAKTSFRRKEADLTSQGTRARKQDQRPSHNLLEGVQESLYGRLFPCIQGTKQTLAKAQTSTPARITHQQRWGQTPLLFQGNRPHHQAVQITTSSPSKWA